MKKLITDIPQKELFDGFNGRFFHTESYTIAFWEIKKGSILPEHEHFHEQTTQVVQGILEMTINGELFLLEEGMIAHIPPNIIHSGKAITNCKLTDTFCPVREDYK